MCHMTLFWSEIGSGIGEPSGTPQRANKVVFDSPGLLDFATVLNLPDGQVLFFGEIQITEEF